jgi:hypothetical protein
LAFTTSVRDARQLLLAQVAFLCLPAWLQGRRTKTTKIIGLSDPRHSWSACSNLRCRRSRLRLHLNHLKEAFMSAQVEMRTAARERSSSDTSSLTVAILVGAIVIALILSISTGLSTEPQAADYIGYIALP